MKTHLTVKLEYDLKEIAKKIGRSLTDDEIAYLERHLPATIDNEMGEGLWAFITGLIECDYLDGVK